MGSNLFFARTECELVWKELPVVVTSMVGTELNVSSMEAAPKHRTQAWA